MNDVENAVMQQAIIVGHPLSGYEGVVQLLQSSGMTLARPSRREDLTPQQVTAALVRADGVVPGEFAQSLRQIHPAPIWNGLALDFVLGNLDAQLWGWADPQAVSLLEYWKEQDPRAVFVLVYDAPHTALSRLDPDQEDMAAGQLQRHLDGWTTYNTALLDFYLRNPSRCVLVHAGQVQRSVGRSLQLINTRVETPLQLSSIDGGCGQDDAAPATPPALIPENPAGAAAGQGDDACAQFLLDALVEAHPQARSIYEELQAAATLPLETGSTNALTQGLANHYAAWQTYVGLHREAGARTRELAELRTDLKKAQSALDAAQSAVEARTRLQREKDSLQAQLEQVRKELEQRPRGDGRKTDELQEENELLLLQLHQVQEELERYYLENQKLKQGSSKPAQKPLYGAADRIRRQLSYRLGATMIAQSNKRGGWLGMPWALRREVKAWRKDVEARKGQKQPPISSYADAHEADRLRQHLSFRLGAVMIGHSRTLGGWITMPWALRSEARDFYRSCGRAGASPG